ncbi:MAG: hypothetical protein PHG06_00985 [Parabacteroides sp.]|nr:hypothetical protein [Parabacteroides sp.]
MNAEAIYQLIDDINLLNEETLPRLKQIIDEYPYFSIARMLYLKNMALMKDMRFSVELKNQSIYIPDRKKLFYLIEGERYELSPIKENDLDTDENAFSLIDAYLSSHKNNGDSATEASLLISPSVSSDYIYWSLTKKNEKEEKLFSPKLQHQDLIDSFLEEDGGRSSTLQLNLDREYDHQTSDRDTDEKDEEALKPLSDSCFTETLAHIYVKQRRYDRALQIIKSLSLKYPEKNIYFADQIRFLEKLIINNKK